MKVLKTLHISTYVPRECGIATFTKNLTDSILGSNLVERHILALVEPNNHLSYPPEVYAKLKFNDLEGYRLLGNVINNSNFDVVNLQHEFGIYGGENGKYILDLIRLLDKPIVTTFHTVLSNPGKDRSKIVNEISLRSEYVVVMAEAARERLQNIYKVPKNKIKVIPHGVPDFSQLRNNEDKRRLSLDGKIVVSTFGLIGASKGIEYVIDALPEVVERFPNLLFLVIGKTHPNIRKADGENYRMFLKKRVSELGLTRSVCFVNKYLTFGDIGEFLQATDIYVTPYLEPEQITSGTLSYAIGAGKACISTPYAYAREILDKGVGLIVPFRDSSAITDALLSLLEDEPYRLKISKVAFRSSRKMIWKNVGKEYYKLFKKASGK